MEKPGMSPMESDGVAADLFKLWRAGRIFLPLIGEVYSESGRDLQSTRLVQSMFILPGTEDPSPIAAEWQAVQSILQYVLDESCINVLDTGQALLNVVDMYIESDLLTTDEIDALEADIENYPLSPGDPGYDPDDPLHQPPQDPVPRPDDPVGIGTDPRGPDATSGPEKE